MSDHLPECLLASDCKHDYYDEPPIQCANCGEECICDRLRACEARVTAPSHYHDLGYAAGLSAARDAVANLPVAITVVHDTPFLNKQGMGVCENPDKYPHGIVQVAALAAIDGLANGGRDA